MAHSAVIHSGLAAYRPSAAFRPRTTRRLRPHPHERPDLRPGSRAHALARSLRASAGNQPELQPLQLRPQQLPSLRGVEHPPPNVQKGKPAIAGRQSNNLTDPSGFSWVGKAWDKVGNWFSENWRTVVVITVVAAVTWGVGSALSGATLSAQSSTAFASYSVATATTTECLKKSWHSGP